MKNTFGNALTLTIFGESHGKAVGAVLDGIAPGLSVSEESIKAELLKRRPFGAISTGRREKDEFSVLSGVYLGKTTGTPLCIVIENRDTRPQDYESVIKTPRPGHADFAADVKYRGFCDPRGGGHQSARVTAALCAACAIIKDALLSKGIKIMTHIKRCACIDDMDFCDLEEDYKSLSGKSFSVLSDGAGALMIKEIEKAASVGDSVGGVLETAAWGLPAGLGEPWFDSAESLLSHALFSIPAVKGVEFGQGFKISDMKGSFANDPFYADGGVIKTRTNNNGGVLGGITNGMPVLFRACYKPTPTIRLPQETVDLNTLESVTLKAEGRHDPCVLHRACAVQNAVTALCIADMLTQRFGTEFFTK